jgi:hypothetical protein
VHYNPINNNKLCQKTTQITTLNITMMLNFFHKFFLQPKWLSLIGRCKKSGVRPLEDLTNFGYKPNMKAKS